MRMRLIPGALAILMMAVASPVVAVEANDADPPKVGEFTQIFSPTTQDLVTAPTMATATASAIAFTLNLAEPGTPTRASPATASIETIADLAYVASGDQNESLLINFEDYSTELHPAGATSAAAANQLTGAFLGVTSTNWTRVLDPERRWRLHTEPAIA